MLIRHFPNLQSKLTLKCRKNTEYLNSCPEKLKVQCTALMAPEACKRSRRPHSGWLQGPETSVENPAAQKVLLLCLYF